MTPGATNNIAFTNPDGIDMVNYANNTPITAITVANGSQGQFTITPNV